jgi:leucyl aminopeptidase
MISAFADKADRKALSLTVVTEAACQALLATQPAPVAAWLKANSFSGKAGSFCLVPSDKGGLHQVFAGAGAGFDIWTIAGLPTQLPAGTYRLVADAPPAALQDMALGWALGSYRFTRYKAAKTSLPRLILPKATLRSQTEQQALALTRGRDLINTPAEDMGPADIASAIRGVAKTYGAKIKETVGDALLKARYPMIHTVGRASTRPPRLVDLTWGNPKHPRVTLVGKGVCFDSGGLDIKPSSGMLLMKKDMGGAAVALAVAEMVMAAGLKVRLRLLVPTVDNAISGNAFRPLDVLQSRKGLTVEVGNTDAEGRLILADALTEADSENPEILIDFATLTGAARVALGTELPALFCTDDGLADGLLKAGVAVQDPLWRLPFWDPYAAMLDSKVADLNSAPSDGGYAGAITAALFLRKFVSRAKAYAHIDLMGWILSAKPGRPVGGEVMAARAVFRLLQDRFKK